MSRYCTKCGAVNDDVAQYCIACQAPLSAVGGASSPIGGSSYQPMQSVNQVGGAMTDLKALGAEKKTVSGIVAILLGAFGVHKFLLGYTTEGVIMLAISVVSCGTLAFVPWIIGIIEGIMYLTKTDEEFAQMYIVGKKTWF